MVTMSDLIDRNDAVEVMELPSAEQWTHVTKALPKEKGEYLVSYYPHHWDAVSENMTSVYKDKDGDYCCGNCDYFLNEDYIYCPCCGEKLNWREVEDE